MGFIERLHFWSSVEEKISDFPKVISKENSKTHEIEPWDMHHVLAYAKMVITDSQTMGMEASVLGVPSLRYNSFAGQISCLGELENEYGLTFGFIPGRDEDKMLDKLDDLLSIEDLRKEWLEKRDLLLKSKKDFNRWLIEFFNSEANSL